MGLDGDDVVDTRDVDLEQRKRARRAVNRAIRNGDLVRPTSCERCDVSPERAKNGKALIDAHHRGGYDEDHWLDIIWVCQSCHQKVHARRHGIPHTDEAKKRIGITMRNMYKSGELIHPDMRGDKNPFFGKTHSIEVRQRISEARRGVSRFHTEETKRRIGEAQPKRKKPNTKILCDLCDNLVAASWITRHKDSGCVVA